MYKTTSTYKPLSYLSGIRLLFAAGIILLAYHPVNWLVRTWFDPSYQSQGLLVMALVTGFCLWSITSPRIHADDLSGRRAVILLCLTALVRLAGQLLGVNVIGAVALVIDAYALSLLLGLHQRRRALAPGWLAILFAFSLPLERIIQRTIGFFLQQVSAAGACQVLSLGADPVRCEGVRILLAGQDVLVDLPCSGARTLMLLLLLFAALATLTRPAIGRALMGLSLTLVAAMAANVFRIVILALGVAYPQYFGGISVMEAPGMRRSVLPLWPWEPSRSWFGRTKYRQMPVKHMPVRPGTRRTEPGVCVIVIADGRPQSASCFSSAPQSSFHSRLDRWTWLAASHRLVCLVISAAIAPSDMNCPHESAPTSYATAAVRRVQRMGRMACWW